MTTSDTHHVAARAPSRPRLHSVEAIAESAPKPYVRIGEDPETIRVLTDVVGHRMIPDTYVTDGTPVVVEPISGAGDPTAGDEDVGIPLAATPLRPPLLASLLARHVEVRQPKTNGEETETTPSAQVLTAVLSGRSWPELPVLRRIIRNPILRPDGTLLQIPGYDPATGYYLAQSTPLEPVPDQPARHEVTQAREFLVDRFLADFPWRSLADKANYLALLVTPIIRPFSRSLSPFGVIEATMPGSGKTILTGCVGLLVGQRVMTWTDSEDELRKSITAVLADQVGVVVFDNLEEGTVIGSAVLARLMTERTWTDRRLGTNAATSYPNDRLWLATGNNLRTGGDMASRSVWVRLDPNCPAPEARTGFTIPHLDTWILDPANQATVLRAVLTLVLDWTAAGAPTSSQVPEMRQFTRWAQYLGGFLEHHQIPEFLTNAANTRALDEDATQWRSFLLRWHHIHGNSKLGTAELRRSAEPGLGSDAWSGTFPTTASGQPLSVVSLGRRFLGQVDRWRGDVVLRSEIDDHANSKVYWVEHPRA